MTVTSNLPPTDLDRASAARLAQSGTRMQERMSQCVNAFQGVRKHTGLTIRQDQEHGLGILIRAVDTDVDTQRPWNSRQLPDIRPFEASRELTKRLRVRREPWTRLSLSDSSEQSRTRDEVNNDVSADTPPLAVLAHRGHWHWHWQTADTSERRSLLLERSSQRATKSECYRWCHTAIVLVRLDTICSKVCWSSSIKLLRRLTPKPDDGPRDPAGNSLWKHLRKGWARSKQCCETASRPRGLLPWGQAETACAFSNARYDGLSTNVVSTWSADPAQVRFHARPTCLTGLCWNERSARLCERLQTT